MEKPKKMYAKSYILNRKIVVYNADEIDKWHNHVTQPLDEVIEKMQKEMAVFDGRMMGKKTMLDLWNALLEYKRRGNDENR